MTFLPFLLDFLVGFSKILLGFCGFFMFTGAFRGYRAIPVRSQSSFSAIWLRLKEFSFLFFSIEVSV